MSDEIRLDSIDEALAALARGELIIVVDDEDRENEGDFIMAAEKVTPASINFVAKHGLGFLLAHQTQEAGADRNQRAISEHAGGEGVRVG